MNMLVRALAALESDEAEAFLVDLLYGLGMGGRGEYPEADKSDRVALAALRGVNELVLATATELKSLRSGVQVRPSRDFIDVLVHKSQVAGCEAALAFAFTFALDGYPEPHKA